MPDAILIAQAKSEIGLLPQVANRHGLIAGVTGTGKTVTPQRIAEGQVSREIVHGVLGSLFGRGRHR
jgi:DNA helicase HerA-like ATPase